jgi:hypothetical protein
MQSAQVRLRTAARHAVDSHSSGSTVHSVACGEDPVAGDVDTIVGELRPEQIVAHRHRPPDRPQGVGVEQRQPGREVVVRSDERAVGAQRVYRSREASGDYPLATRSPDAMSHR